RGKQLLELGCGGAQWSIQLAEAGARSIGLDLSERQLVHALMLMQDAGQVVPLVQASAEDLPFKDGSFDVVYCDYGAMVFADPYRTVPEAARVLRPGGLFAFCTVSNFLTLCWPDGVAEPDDRLHF
ncbi:MAG: class I SAM-dependent methyltransferase, partial [Dehalococcoidia bacterium]